MDTKRFYLYVCLVVVGVSFVSFTAGEESKSAAPQAVPADGKADSAVSEADESASAEGIGSGSDKKAAKILDDETETNVKEEGSGSDSGESTDEEGSGEDHGEGGEKVSGDKVEEIEEEKGGPTDGGASVDSAKESSEKSESENDKQDKDEASENEDTAKNKKNSANDNEKVKEESSAAKEEGSKGQDAEKAAEKSMDGDKEPAKDAGKSDNDEEPNEKKDKQKSDEPKPEDEDDDDEEEEKKRKLEREEQFKKFRKSSTAARLRGSGKPRISATSQAMKKYGIVIDAGSSGTRIHVYTWFTDESGSVRVNTDPKSKKIRPGLSSYKDSPAGAGKSVQELMDYARSVVPDQAQKETPVLLMATAGMRKVYQDSTAAGDAVFQSVREVLASSGFWFMPHWADVIPGEDEGFYGWVSINYLLNNFEDGRSTVGALELGGASTQITFEIDNKVSPDSVPVPSAYTRTLQIGNDVRKVYTHSFLGYGLDMARKREATDLYEHEIEEEHSENVMVDDDPCTIEGFSEEVEGPKNPFQVKGDGDFDKCKRTVTGMFTKTDSCKARKACVFTDAFMPPIKPNTRFIAFEWYARTIRALGISEDSSVRELEDAGRWFCDFHWSELKGMPQFAGFEDWELKSVCFSSAYIASMLTEGFGITEDKKDNVKLHFQQEVDDVEINWALGALFYKLSDEKSEVRNGSAFGSVLPLFLLLCVVIAVMTYRMITKRRGGSDYLPVMTSSSDKVH